jgi:hypothetical protein
LVVAADHWRIAALRPEIARLFDDKMKCGFNAGYAVMFFYIISGFLITFTLKGTTAAIHAAWATFAVSVSSASFRCTGR